MLRQLQQRIGNPSIVLNIRRGYVTCDVDELQLSNKPRVLSALIVYYVMVKIKAEMDQYKESFETFKFMQMLKTNTEE